MINLPSLNHVKISWLLIIMSIIVVGSIIKNLYISLAEKEMIQSTYKGGYGSFLRYEPSDLERSWLESDHCLHSCQSVLKLYEQIIPILQDPKDSVKNHGKKIFSRFVYGDEVSEVYDWIEPIFGITRSQTFCYDYKRNTTNVESIYDLSYILNSQLEVKSCMIIDYGGSPIYGASRWLFNSGCPIKSIFAIDPAPFNQEYIFENIPDEIIMKYHWMNIKATPTLYRKLVGGTDKVILKIDIDGANFNELEVLQNYISEGYPWLTEVYLEDHVLTEEMLSYWGTYDNKRNTCDSQKLFSSIRHKGHRIHYWV
jgi:hypothetical protein